MNLLILGHSSLVRRRILPAAVNGRFFKKIDLGTSRSNVEWNSGAAIVGYGEALKKSDAELVYISLTNQAHAEWARQALLSGRHVIVDKPAFLDLQTSLELSEIAEQKNLLLAEATVYEYHPQIATIQKLYSDHKDSCKRIVAQLSVPPFEAGNFRYRKELGGGAVLDLGPYAVSIGRIFFQEEPSNINCAILSRHQEVESAFSISLTYSQGRSVVGHFGFDTEYSNYLRLLGSKVNLWGDRVFTTAPTQEQTLHARIENKDQTIHVPAADSFESFFQSVTTAGSSDFDFFRKKLVSDARVRAKLQESL